MISGGDFDRRLVVEQTASRIEQASELFGQNFAAIPVLFDLRGRAAGMYRVRNGERVIRYNPFIFERYFEDNLAQTVPHEVAHYIADIVYGFRNIRPHGPEWKQIMRFFGADTRATSQYNLDGLPLRRYRQFQYRCPCREHALTSRRHNRIERNEVRYFCSHCGGRLRFVGPAVKAP
ncbi:MAG: SprT family zinc-dependent metalloprotease [Acidiferrobacterales bacterium]